MDEAVLIFLKMSDEKKQKTLNFIREILEEKEEKENRK